MTKRWTVPPALPPPPSPLLVFPPTPKNPFSSSLSATNHFTLAGLHVHWCMRPARNSVTPIQPPPIQGIRQTQSRGSGCLFSSIAVETPSLGWEVRYRPEAKFNTHNHPPSQSPAAHPSHRRLPVTAQNTAQSLFLAGNN